LLSLVRTVLITGMAVIGVAIVSAVVLAIVDVYLTGQGGPSIREPLVVMDEFVSLSAADIVLLLVVVGTAILVGRAQRTAGQ
jgi:hypothetical protein